jgi:ribosomal protein S18 acetylase RimI-like enzyme
MELYAKYIKEREDANLEYNDKGFMSWKRDGNGVFILDAYVKPEYRKYGVCRKLLNSIIESTKTKEVYTTTDINANNWELSEKAIIALGFKKNTTIGSLNYYIMNIEREY